MTRTLEPMATRPPVEAHRRSAVRRTVTVLMVIAAALYVSLFVRAWLLT